MIAFVCYITDVMQLAQKNQCNQASIMAQALAAGSLQPWQKELQGRVDQLVKELLSVFIIVQTVVG